MHTELLAGTALCTGFEHVQFSVSCNSTSIWSNGSELNGIGEVVQSTTNILIWSLWIEWSHSRSGCSLIPPVIVVLVDFEKMVLTITKWRVVKEVTNCRNESLTVSWFLMLFNLSLPFVDATLENRRSGKSTLSGSQKKGRKYYFHLIFLPI